MNMDLNLVTALIGIVAGAIGYWLATFSIQPILRYRSVRSQVLSNFIYYAQVVNAEHLNCEMKNLQWERKLANRKSAADLNASIEEFPYGYLKYLSFKKIYPRATASRLIAYSNNSKDELSLDLENSIRKNLGLPNDS